MEGWSYEGGVSMMHYSHAHHCCQLQLPYRQGEKIYPIILMPNQATSFISP